MWGNGRGVYMSSPAWLLLLFVFIWNAQAEDNEAIVVTKQGQVRGTHLPSPSGPVTAFLGIPFGEPPVGELRFKKPLPAKAWQGILDATKYGHSCYQKVYEMIPGFESADKWNPNTDLNEDCLYLNVWVPSPSPSDASVMVFIYGGAFAAGTSSLTVYDPRILVQSENVIVVSMNYRIGPLGFLALPGNSEAPGNAGLFDQQLAMQWIQENIAAFGGNANSVTLFGMSAGAASVGYHILSSSSQQIFTRAISEGGSFNAPCAVLSQTEARNRALRLAQLLGCSQANETEVILCLQTKSPKEITDHQYSVVSHNGFFLTHFAPTVDGDFLTDTPDTLMKLGKFNQADILAGFTKDEGSLFLFMEGHHFTKDKDFLLTRAEFEEGVKFLFPEATELGVESILFQYTDWEDESNTEKNRDALNHAMGDYHFVCPISGLAKQVAERGNNVFMYMFDHRSTADVLPEWMGAIHCAERAFLFGEPMDGVNMYTNAEKALSWRIMRYWANFARTGNPNGVGTNENDWPPFTSLKQKYITLNTEPPQIKTKPRAKQCKFWDSFYPKVLKITGISAGAGSEVSDSQIPGTVVCPQGWSSVWRPWEDDSCHQTGKDNNN